MWMQMRIYAGNAQKYLCVCRWSRGRLRGEEFKRFLTDPFATP
jgi:hypothetical protein